ncbi:kinase-like protein [Tothia fuscella]|uniref:Kinase-like protein n=1 Tax=Tothia fuscella TaxID=1048955 RepID=A0A9P4TYY9_9PEZI|nr:kinase-like protein [Tothia fuscella]
MPNRLEILKRWYGDGAVGKSGPQIKRSSGDDKALLEGLPGTKKSNYWPYYASTESLPAPLPTIEDIIKVRGTENEIGDNTDGIVCLVNEVFVVKMRAGAQIIEEAENLLFLARNSKVRVPKVYAAFTGPPAIRPENIPPGVKIQFHYIIMEYIEGGNLQENWEHLDDDERIEISKKIAEQLKLLRQTPSPGYYGRVDRQPYSYRAEHYTRPNQPLAGPFDNYSDLCQSLYKAAEYQLAMACVEPTPFLPVDELWLDLYRTCLLKCSLIEPKFTHGDLKFENIMLKPVKANGNKRNFDVVFVDWCRSAWRPAWVEGLRSLGNREHGKAWGPDTTAESWEKDSELALTKTVFQVWIFRLVDDLSHPDVVAMQQLCHQLFVSFY